MLIDQGKDVILKLDWVDYETCVLACTRWHYSRSTPTSKTVKIGVWENDEFIGVIMFGSGSNRSIASPYGLKQTQVCELVRIALREHKTPVSRIISIALKMLKKQSPGIKLVVSYADSNYNHHGGIYQGSNWIYTGEYAKERGIKINGKLTHRRTINQRLGSSKVEFLKTKYKNVEVIMDKPKHKYLYPFDEGLRKSLMQQAKPYPKRASIG